MTFPDIAAKKLSDAIPPLKDQNIPYLVAAATGGVGVQYARVTQVGASPFTITFTTASPARAGQLRPMQDNQYMAIAYDLTSQAFLNVPLANITAAAFNVTGGANNDVLAVLVIGRLAGLAT